MSVTDDRVWMTPEALRRLESELAELTRDAGPRDAAERARAVTVRDLLRRAEVEAKPDDGLVEPGMVITARFHDDLEERFLLGARELITTDDGIDVYSPDSPLGRAITGRYVGDRVDYVAPSGATITVAITAATPYR